MSLNLVWFVVRFVSVAVDQFIFFETHEAVRRIGHIGMMLAMLAGLPLIAFLDSRESALGGDLRLRHFAFGQTRSIWENRVAASSRT